VATAQATVDIQRPPEAVWAYLTDFPRNPEWLTQVEQVQVNTTPPGLGTRITELRRVPGRTVEGVIEISEWQPPHRLRKTSPSGALRADGIYELTRTPGGGTRLSFNLVIRGAGVLKLAEWLMSLGLQKDTEQVLCNLKQCVEAEPRV
jgi:uncharacterized protein YndB with AHSA1/START domain